MKNKINNILFFLAVLCVLLTACTKDRYDIKTPDYNIAKPAQNIRVAVASDLHTGAVTVGDTSFNGNYAPEILDAFVAALKDNDADVLLLCGDISNSSRYSQHKELIEKLYNIQNNGTLVFVLPGNHDIGEMKKEEFADYYADFGYA